MSKLLVDEIRSADRSVSSSANMTFADDGNVSLGGTLSAGTIGGGVSMASSGLTVRNIEQVALGSNQSLHTSSTLTTFFSPTYTPKFSGSKVQGNLTMLMYALANGLNNGRKRLDLAYSGTNITDITFAALTDTIGGYDYGGSGIIVYYCQTLCGPLIETSGTSTITCDCKMGNAASHSGSEWLVFADNTLKSTHFTWIEYK